MRSLRVAGLVLGTFLMVSLTASAHDRLRGSLGVGAGFGFGRGIGVWGLYDPFYSWGWGYEPYAYYPAYYSDAGQVKLKTNVKDAQVYINGAFAGKASKLKSLWLRPDAYNVEVRAAGYTSYAERVYVVPGRTIHVDAELAPAARP